MSRRKRRVFHNLVEPKSWRAIFLSKGGNFAVAVLVISLCVGALAVFYTVQERFFTTDAQIVIADVVEKRLERTVDGLRYFATFRYENDVGKIWQQTRPVRSGTYARLLRDLPVPVRFSPGGPQIFDVDVDSWKRASGDYAVGAFALFCLAVVIAFYAFMETRRSIGARQFGERRLAKVTDIVEHSKSGAPSGFGHMVLRLDTGERCESRSHVIRQLRAIGIGTKVNVFLYDGVMVWEGDVGPRASRKSDMPTVKR